jgi:hypothetical protein
MAKVSNPKIEHEKYYYDNGNIQSEQYYLNDNRHRTNVLNDKDFIRW